MIRRHICAGTLILLLVSVSVFVFYVQPVKAATIVVPDDYLTIQEAINNANQGDTIFVRNGTYYEHVVVNKTVSLVGEDKYAVVINGSLLGVETLNITAGNVRVSDLHVTDGWFWAIVIHGGNTTVSDCIITVHGIYVDSSRNKIVSNLMGPGYNAAIELYYSHNNTIVDNVISGWVGTTRSSTTFFARYSNYSRIYHNNFVDDTWYWRGFSLLGSYGIRWDNGCEGNYWNICQGNDTDGDGVFEEYNVYMDLLVDYYPLVNPYWIPADINHDLTVGILDVVRITGAYGATPSSLHWNPHADIAEPFGKIDIFDIVLCTSHYAESYP